MASRLPTRAIRIVAARSIAALVICLVVYFLAPIGQSTSGSVVVRSAIALSLLLVVVTAQTVAVARAPMPVLRAIEALSISVTLLLVTSAATYLTISTRSPSAFTEPLDHVDALYLSLMTMTTIGFGDIGTVSQGARLAVMAQMVCNFLVLGVAARTVLHYTRRATARFDRTD